VCGIGLAAASGRPFVPSFIKIGHLLRSLKRRAGSRYGERVRLPKETIALWLQTFLDLFLTVNHHSPSA
jgi:hypothetical protein